MTRYAIAYSDRAQKDLRSIRDARTAAALRDAITALADTPRPPGAKKLAGPSGLWRVRVGDWRILYRIEDGRLLVLVVRVALRGEVYGRLGR